MKINKIYRNIYIKINKMKTSFLSRNCAITTFLSQKSMITRLSIASEDFLGSSIAPHVMPPCPEVVRILIEQGGCSIDQVRDSVVRN